MEPKRCRCATSIGQTPPYSIPDTSTIVLSALGQGLLQCLVSFRLRNLILNQSTPSLRARMRTHEYAPLDHKTN
jgi:hypothetical protein